MNLGQLLQAVRVDLDDTVGPSYLYADEDLTRYANNAVTEACLRARLLHDDHSRHARVALVAGQARYSLSPEVFAVRAVHVPGRAEPLIRTNATRMDWLVPGWSHQAQTPGIPKYAVYDVQQKTLTLHPPPSEAGTAHLRVWRQPDETERMEEADDDVAVAMAAPETLKHWVLFEAYSRKDGESGDDKRAADHLALFAAIYGERPSEHVLNLWSTQPTTGPRRAALDY